MTQESERLREALRAGEGDPHDGFWQDAVQRIYDLERIAETEEN